MPALSQGGYARAHARSHARFLHGTAAQAQDHPSAARILTRSLSMRRATLCIHNAQRAHPRAAEPQNT
eukprot:1294592-Alexandrium_andersonii.AAC.1